MEREGRPRESSVLYHSLPSVLRRNCTPCRFVSYLLLSETEVHINFQSKFYLTLPIRYVTYWSICSVASVILVYICDLIADLFQRVLCSRIFRDKWWVASIASPFLRDLTCQKAILLLRTCAIWENKKKVTYPLFALLIVCIAGTGYFMEKFILSLGE